MATHNIAPQTGCVQISQTNCHNCGALIKGPECEYCGTIFHSQTSEQSVSTAETELIKAQKSFREAQENYKEQCKQRHLDLIQALSNAKYGI